MALFVNTDQRKSHSSPHCTLSSNWELNNMKKELALFQAQPCLRWEYKKSSGARTYVPLNFWTHSYQAQPQLLSSDAEHPFEMLPINHSLASKLLLTLTSWLRSSITFAPERLRAAPSAKSFSPFRMMAVSIMKSKKCWAVLKNAIFSLVHTLCLERNEQFNEFVAGDYQPSLPDRGHIPQSSRFPINGRLLSRTTRTCCRTGPDKGAANEGGFLFSD